MERIIKKLLVVGVLLLVLIGYTLTGRTAGSIGQVSIWLMNGANSVSQGSAGLVSDLNWEIKGVGDFNGGGSADILWRHATSGQVYLWLMNGTTSTAQGSLGTVDPGWDIKSVSDFNGDGKADILWRHASTGQVYLWFMDGTTLVGQGPVSTVNLGWEIKSVGDFNGDGKADILWRHTSTGQVYLWFMNGTNSIAQGPVSTVDLGWEIKSVGDFNGDGKADILWRHAATGQVHLWLMNGTTLVGQGPVSTVDLGWEIKSVGDFNGDGKADILWRQSSTGQVYLWLMNGSTLVGQGSLGTVDPGWEIKSVGDFNGDKKADILWRQVASVQTNPAPTGNGYTLIGWNDLGMHCINPKFDNVGILPPYNNLWVQVVRKGNPPTIATSGFTLDYSIINNTTSASKLNFWQYVLKLFGVSLPPDQGLTGNGLSGRMQLVGDHFEATGIPVTPYDDNKTWNPYQRAVVTMKDPSGNVIATTEVVLPVSDEMHCEKCHADGGVAAVGIRTGSVETNVLTLHDQRTGTALMSNRPVLCASCHSDNALGTKGTAGVASFSLAMHNRHGSLSSTSQPSCYDCHPGPNTQCNRSAIEEMGPSGTNPNCQNCHGTLTQVATALKQGRQPWLQEPTCTQCHGSRFTTNQPLYRHSTGMGGVYCAACHNSPHAWWPSKLAVDNTQPLRLQGRAGPIGNCQVCHTNSPGGNRIHGG